MEDNNNPYWNTILMNLFYTNSAAALTAQRLIR